MPGGRAVFWATVAAGASCSAVGGLAAERWTLDGVDSYYFGSSASEPDYRSSSALPVKEDASDAPPASYIYASAAYSPAREATSEMAAAAAADRWQRRVDADDRRWQARMDAEFRREERVAELGQEKVTGVRDHAEDAERLRQADGQFQAAADGAPTSDRPTPGDAEDPA